MYMVEKKSGLEIARFFGIGRTTVSRYIKRYGLPPRTSSEVRQNKFWRGTETQYKNVSKAIKKRVGEDHPRWKGGFYAAIHMERSEYEALHKWVRQQLGTPHRCERCGTTGLTGKQIHWANKSGKYLQEADDWLRLCVKCHREHDKSIQYN